MEHFQFIEYLVSNADDFKVISIVHHVCQMHIAFKGRKIMVGSKSWKDVYYPRLLQDAIEGINNYSYFNNSYFEIIQLRWGIDLIDHRLPAPKNKIEYFRYESNGAKSYLTTNAKIAVMKCILNYPAS